VAQGALKRYKSTKAPTGVAWANARKTHCKRGHKLSGKNLEIGVIKRNGKLYKTRRCRKCKLAWRDKKNPARKQRGRVSSQWSLLASVRFEQLLSFRPKIASEEQPTIRDMAFDYFCKKHLDTERANEATKLWTGTLYKRFGASN
jgi:hypothetical protein